MQVMNKGKRSFIFDPSIVVSGGEASHDKRVMYLNPGEKAEIKDEAALKLTQTYDDLIAMDSRKPKKKD